ncbi:ice-structuring protein 4-like [Monodelphis domestica]|uniref:ice-structuring protein 4-like n=1 Tax=Monodelphis domestica TaxID=13616 RepID=UPI0024E1E51E|nr:ice-structuring protein 4-like [Monodelphis domestica]
MAINGGGELGLAGLQRTPAAYANEGWGSAISRFTPPNDVSPQHQHLLLDAPIAAVSAAAAAAVAAAVAAASAAAASAAAAAVSAAAAAAGSFVRSFLPFLVMLPRASLGTDSRL